MEDISSGRAGSASADLRAPEVRTSEFDQEGTCPAARAEDSGVKLERAPESTDDAVAEMRAQMEQLRAENRAMAKRLAAAATPPPQRRSHDSDLADLGLGSLVLRVVSLGVPMSAVDEALHGRDREAKAALLSLLDVPASLPSVRFAPPAPPVSAQQRDAKVHVPAVFKVCHPDLHILEDGALVRNLGDIDRPSTAICKDAIMATDHTELAYADFKMVECSSVSGALGGSVAQRCCRGRRTPGLRVHRSRQRSGYRGRVGPLYTEWVPVAQRSPNH